MTSFLYDLKSQATIFNILIVLLIMAFIFYRFNKRKLSICLIIFSTLIILLCSTAYLPNYLAAKIERKYPALLMPAGNPGTGKTLIHVLGSGYTLDSRLPPNAQIAITALGRLAEGIRIHRLIKNSIIICSGNSPDGLETQAQVTKKAAISLGVDADELETLDTPTTTIEEAAELGKIYDKKANVILVTDALHMPRAIKIFESQGFTPVAAPTNFRIKVGQKGDHMRWWPSFGNINMMNYLLHEYLGSLKVSPLILP